MKALILSVFLLVAMMVSTSNATLYTRTLDVSTGTLWMDTGILLSPSLSAKFFGAFGSWTIRDEELIYGWAEFGPEGLDTSAWGDEQFLNDEFLKNYQHGQLIGYIGNLIPAIDSSDPLDLMEPFNPLDFFAIGTDTIIKSDLSGNIWLGFNDDAFSDAVDDNRGFATVNIDVTPIDLPPMEVVPVPEPSTLLLFSASLIGLGILRRRASR
ncbi:PEP-CTERM sorting domain-containing protein [Geobacter sp.]|uniref:PEP-CTERM sorting domain-containing protein n=1 Tax=Geobacter sp. TaxID=46610 RepID=UPI001AD437A8|nr:PEP-CTERM sorting domain-containing protein [Geobacter sp.]CAG0979468.1 hypothetical protein ANRL3_02040 [Anaerolineae bacterium]